jgi:RTX calcium-binding nonapeptide repeat (4 copies)
MDFLLLSSLVIFGGLLSLAGLFDGNGNSDSDTGEETLHGGAGADTLAGNGQSHVEGWGGNDDLTLIGHDIGQGNAGDDHLHSTSRNAVSYGGDGDDTLDGNTNLSAHGDAGNDDLFISSGGSGWGDTGDDLLTHEANDAHSFGKSLHGGAGDDTILGNTADTMLDGGAGNDLLIVEHSNHANSDSLHIDLAEGNDTVLLDPNAVFTTDTTGGQNPVVLHNFGPDDRIVFGDDPQTSYEGMNWIKNDDGSFTLFQAAETGNTATNLTAFTLDGLEPQLVTPHSYGFSSFMTQNWSAVPLTDLRGFVPVSNSGFDTSTVGTNGNDKLSQEMIDVFGLDGNDTLSVEIEGDAFGGNGDDRISSFVTTAYGGAGEDTLSTEAGTSYGGDGDDVIHLYDGSSDIEYNGAAYGGIGDDTIIAHETLGDGGHIYGGEGDDQITAFTSASIHAGDGDDTIFFKAGATDRSDMSIKLGAGHDTIFLEPTNGILGSLTEAPTHSSIADFDTTQDHLALIIPQADLADWQVTHAVNVAGNYTEFTITGPTTDNFGMWTQIIRVDGVTATLPPLALYNDEAAALAGNSYGNLTSAAV